MNCKQAKAEIALWVGNDLDESEERSLRRHLSNCLGCRKHLKSMKAGMRILQKSGEDFSGRESASLWPRLSVALATAEEQNARPSRFNGWIPALAVAAACLAMVSLSNTRPTGERSGDDALPMRVQPIGSDVFLGPDSPSNVLRDLDPSLLDLDSDFGLRRIGDRHSAIMPKRKAETRRVRYEDR